MFRKKDPGNSPKVEQAVAKAVSYELTVADMARKSERRAWWVAGASLVMSLALAGGYYYMLPLKEKVPFLVMADAYTGTASVARLQGDFGSSSVTHVEAVNRSNVAQYVLAHESYDLALMQLRDWNLVFTMSADNIAAQLRARYARTNPQSPVVLYGNTKAIRVKILSITPIGELDNGGFRGASVRVQRTLVDKNSGASTFMDNRLVTLRFNYDAKLALNDQDRLLNPLGFQVTEYRVDSDYAAAVPMPDQAATDAQAQQQAMLQAQQQAAVQADPAMYDPTQQMGQGAIDPVTGQPTVAPAPPAPGQMVPAQQGIPGQGLPGAAGPGQAVPAQGYPVQTAPVPGAPAQQAPGRGTPVPARNLSTGTADGASNR